MQVLAQQVDGGLITLGDARRAIEKLALGSTSVATLSYQFFTGSTPSLDGLNYLVSPGGGNANNLNSAYYQGFSLENRYINFAVNLGKGGEGAARFTADYGALTLSAATAKAYAQIFGVAPDAAKLNALLNDLVPNGRGGTYTRAEYFASFGGDGATGIGTKAAMVGWLLAAAVKENLGPYALSNSAFLADLSSDGLAGFRVDLIGAYGDEPRFATGATLTVGADQSIGLGLTTNNSDVLTGAAGKGAIVTGDGNDTVTLLGVVTGSLDLGGGNDLVTISGLEAAAGVAGSGVINAGAGNDQLTIWNGVGANAVVDGGTGDDTLVVRGLNASAKVSGVEHVFITGAPFTGVYVDPSLAANQYRVSDTQLVGVHDIWNVSADGSSLIASVGGGVVLGLKDTVGSLSATYATGVQNAEIHLDNVHVGPFGTVVDAANLTGTLTVRIDNNSAVTALSARQAGAIVLTGTGTFTAASVGIGFNGGSDPAVYTPLTRTLTFDASAAAGVDIGVIDPRSLDNIAILSGGDDRLGLDLSHAVRHTLTLGTGSDTLKINSVASGALFGNVSLTNGKVTTFATVTDFQKGVDHLDLGAAIVSQATGLQAFVTGATSLEDALAKVSSHVAVGAFGVFEYGGDSYVYRQAGALSLGDGDGLIKLVGVTSLSIGTGAGLADIHYGAGI